MKFVVLLGKCILFLASCALVTFISLFVVGAYLTTWPIMRVSPRNARMKALMDLAVSGMALARAYGLDSAMMAQGASDGEDEAA